MKKSNKAALWSALAFPGAGHFLLRRFERGIVLLGVTVCALWYLVDIILASGLVDKVRDLEYKMLSGEVPLDLSAMLRLIDLPQSSGAEIASWIFLACWVAGVADSYRIAAREEKLGQVR